MTLKEANFQVEQLENQYEYYLNEKASLEGLVLPRSMDIKPEKVDGGKLEDNLSKYIELKDIKQIDEMLAYIHAKKQNLLTWIENELKILGKYDQVEQLVVYYKEIDTRKLSWIEISTLVHYSVSQCKRIYRRYKKLRDFER